MDQLDLSLSKGRHSLEGSVKVDGDVEAWTGFGNVVIAPLGVGIITPYVGARARFAHFDFDIKALDIFRGQIPIGADQSETKLALKGIGANLALGYHFGLYARYSYIWANTATDKTKSATSAASRSRARDTSATSPPARCSSAATWRSERGSCPGRFTRAQGLVSPGADGRRSPAGDSAAPRAIRRTRRP